MKRPPSRDPLGWHAPDSRLAVERTMLDTFPYGHADVWATPCFDLPSGPWYRPDGVVVFGIPFDREQGMAFYHVTRHGAERVGRPDVSDAPTCPFHDERMVVTKRFDFGKPERLQFKCPHVGDGHGCYLTATVEQ